jgi:hypothetical protein
LVRVQPPQPILSCSNSHIKKYLAADDVFSGMNAAHRFPERNKKHVWLDWTAKASAGALVLLGCGFLGWLAEAGRREDRAGPALNPLKGSSACLPPYGSTGCTRLAKHKALKTQRFDFRTAGKKAMPREIFPCALLCTTKKRQNRSCFFPRRLGFQSHFNFFARIKIQCFP